jgi:hypothetical protein
MKELNDIPKENPFRVPEGYFEGLTGRIANATSGIEPAVEKKSIMRILRPYIAVAASIAFLALIGTSALYISKYQNKNHLPIDLTVSELNANYLNDIDLLTLEEKVADSGTFDKIPEVGSNEIIDYLISENIDILDIYEQL